MIRSSHRMPMLFGRALAAASFVLLAGCAGPAGTSPTTTPAAAASQFATDAAKATALIHTVAGDVSQGVATACAIAKPVLPTLQNALTGNAASTVAAVANGCTLEGQVNLTLNDLAPVSATNSGDSGQWVKDTTAALQIAAALAPQPAPQ